MKQLTWKQFGIIVLMICGLILAFSPVDTDKKNISDPNQLSQQILNRNDHISAEQLGEMIIDGDPDYLLIDIRSPEEYEKFHIKTAYNFPLETLFKQETMNELDPDKLLILYSNGGTHAAQAWILLQQYGYENSLVLLGGLNYYVDVYSNPQPPEGVYADSEIFQYQFQKAAGPYLLGDKKVDQDQSASVDKVKIKPVKRKKKIKKADEGC